MNNKYMSYVLFVNHTIVHKLILTKSGLKSVDSDPSTIEFYITDLCNVNTSLLL